MQTLVCLAVVGLLEEDICADASILEACVVLYGCRCDVHIHTAYSAILVVDRVDGVDRLQDVLYGAELGVLASLKGEALVAHILERYNLTAYLLLRKLAAWNSLVLSVIGAVYTAIHAVVREIQGCEHHYAVAIDLLLEAACNSEYALLNLLILHFDEYRSLTV